LDQREVKDYGLIDEYWVCASDGRRWQLLVYEYG